MISKSFARFSAALAAVFSSASVCLATGLPLTPDASALGDYFGYSTAAAGSTVVVGSPNNGPHGAAFVFEPDGSGAWPMAARLAPPDLEQGNIGWSVDFDGRTVIAGGTNFSFSTPAPGANDGVAYLFDKSPSGWSQIGKLDVAGARSDTFSAFDISVAIDGDYAVVGTRWDNATATHSGSAYVFERNKNGANAWGLAAKLAPGDLSVEASFGLSVDVQGDRIVVGAPSNQLAGGYQGSVYEFRRDASGTWAQAAKIDSQLGVYSSFGWSLSLDGDRLAIGAPGRTTEGVVYVMESPASAGEDWEIEAELVGAESILEFGKSVDLAAGMLAVGSPLGPYTGAVPDDVAFLFRADGAGGWNPVLTLKEEGVTQTTAFGHSVSLSASALVIGAFQNDRFGESSGVAYVYTVPEPALGLHALLCVAWIIGRSTRRVAMD